MFHGNDFATYMYYTVYVCGVSLGVGLPAACVALVELWAYSV